VGYFREDSYISRYAPVESVGKIKEQHGLPCHCRTNMNDWTVLSTFSALLRSRFSAAPWHWIVSSVTVYRCPIRRLLSATERIAAGDLNYRASVPGGSEIADLADAFNKMVVALKEKRDAIERHVRSLEAVNLELQTARHEAIRSEKMASVGLLAAALPMKSGLRLRPSWDMRVSCAKSWRTIPRKPTTWKDRSRVGKDRPHCQESPRLRPSDTFFAGEGRCLRNCMCHSGDA
jgi:hypothetical protein